VNIKTLRLPFVKIIGEELQWGATGVKVEVVIGYSIKVRPLVLMIQLALFPVNDIESE
jgi:hypothetical protein